MGIFLFIFPNSIIIRIFAIAYACVARARKVLPVAHKSHAFHHCITLRQRLADNKNDEKQ